jgi:hypothetical protein
MIQSAIYLSENIISVTLDNGKVLSIPVDNENSDYQRLLAWVAEGNVIQPYVAPPPPTKDERADQLFLHSDNDIVLAKVLFELINQVRVLQGQPEISASQFKAYLKNKLD